jgi:hypothetical protein
MILTLGFIVLMNNLQKTVLRRKLGSKGVEENSENTGLNQTKFIHATKP